MSICSEDSWAAIMAELPSIVDEMDVLANQVKRREADYCRSRIRLEELMEDLMMKNHPPRDDDSESEDEDCDALDEDEDDLREMRGYRRSWERCKGRYYGSFEDNTSFHPMRYTEGTIPRDARSEVVLEIFSVQVMETKDGLEWPLHVYGHVAVRDIVDQNRNLLFNRKRDNCHILTQQDSYLLLTGPSRPVMIIDPVTFEVDLKVKRETESEDKMLSLKVFQKRRDDFSVNSRCFSKRSTVEFAFAVLPDAVEATVESVKVVSGSWPDHLRGLVVSRTSSVVQKDIVLLDSRDGRMPITSDGKIELSRSVVSVAPGGELTVCVAASQVSDSSDVVTEGKACFRPKKARRSRGTCYLGFCEVEITVAWSLFTITADQRSRKRSVLLRRSGN